MIKDFPLKLKGITVVVNTVKSLQRRCDLSFFQISHRFLQCIKIVLHCLLRKDHIVIPVQTYQIILGFSEYTEKLFGNGIGFFPVTFFFRKEKKPGDSLEAEKQSLRKPGKDRSVIMRMILNI